MAWSGLAGLGVVLARPTMLGKADMPRWTVLARLGPLVELGEDIAAAARL